MVPLSLGHTYYNIVHESFNHMPPPQKGLWQRLLVVSGGGAAQLGVSVGLCQCFGAHERLEWEVGGATASLHSVPRLLIRVPHALAACPVSAPRVKERLKGLKRCIMRIVRRKDYWCLLRLGLAPP